MHTIQITMLGPKRVGKTSLLTAMYERFESNIGQTNLQLTPDLESSALLQERLGELQSLLDDFEDRGGIEATEGPDPASLRSFIFQLGKKAEAPSLELHFRDYPGGYLYSLATQKDQEFVQSLVTGCDAVLIAIDTPALVESKGQWHEKINRPQQITNLFKRAYSPLEKPKLVILAPVKCEKYMKDEKSAQELLRRIKEGYANLLDFFASQALRSKIAVVVTPVETVGSVIFSRIEVNGGNPHFHFRKIGHDAQYSPKYSEQPLRYVLRFALKRHLDSRNWGLFNFLRDWFGWDDHLKESLCKFANECKTNNGFAVIQGQDLLDLR